MRPRPEGTGAEPAMLWGRLACWWAVAFAGLHFYWALGGDVGLSVSAGPLAAERPLWFVVAGLWGVGALCLLGALLAWLLARSRLRGVPALLARWQGWGVSALLLARGIGVEVLLLTDTSHLSASVSVGQRAWTLALWNPWFIAGGVAFALATLRSRRDTDAGPPPPSRG
ncbi:DUF3995 domain-containing protein [Streptomyces sp. 5-8]|uniref:DUF3995 domain-containing protein n=1 Tax=Streptomyces musisoli TaxID=2802280 RepID=A0ABS1P8Y7_9ACTN|nr:MULTISPECIES: DUF3995 domain-containing protein [Streptomyces]MBL1108845.1 DUF3995 domain-containing protein [Streptomyces musisoli]MBY8842973.1 DUF3995 domain-containing protein [Streptomyces sp. SP2-10]